MSEFFAQALFVALVLFALYGTWDAFSREAAEKADLRRQIVELDQEVRALRRSLNSAE